MTPVAATGRRFPGGRHDPVTTAQAGEVPIGMPLPNDNVTGPVESVVHPHHGVVAPPGLLDVRGAGRLPAVAPDVTLRPGSARGYRFHRQDPKETSTVRRVALAVLLLDCWLVTTPASAAEPLVVDLWPGKVPGDVGIKGQETSRIHQSPLVGPTKLITNVLKPTLMVYPAPKDRNTGTAMIICPGGGYWDLYWELEGEEVAAWLNSAGMTGIILKYRCPRRPGDAKGEPPLGPQLDAQWAVRLVRSRAAEWGIDPHRIGKVGFSAGGHLALATATGFSKRLYEPVDSADEVSCRPDFAVACYSGYLKAKDKDEVRADLRIPADTPPVFLAHASDDRESYGGSDAANSAVMYLALKRAGVPAELHVFAMGDHDFGVRQNDKLPSSWTRLCARWLRSQNLLKPGPGR
jgi:acetyl esterase/lipase